MNLLLHPIILILLTIKINVYFPLPSLLSYKLSPDTLYYSKYLTSLRVHLLTSEVETVAPTSQCY